MTTCTVCKTRLSLDDGTHAHPHCRGAAPLTDAEMTRDLFCPLHHLSDKPERTTA